MFGLISTLHINKNDQAIKKASESFLAWAKAEAKSPLFCQLPNILINNGVHKCDPVESLGSCGQLRISRLLEVPDQFCVKD